MHIAARITENAMSNALNGIKDGVRENLIGAHIQRDLSLGYGAYGGEVSALPPIIASAERTQAAHFTYRTEGCFQKDTHSYLEISGTYKRYHAPLSRTIYIGDPSDEIKKVSEVVVEGLNAALDKIKTGVACEDVERAWQTTINRYGYEKESRCGYAVGCAYAPVWAEDTAYFRPGEKFELKENMTFHVMPGIWIEGFGLAITETVRVTDKGCESITKFPRKLFVNE
jgi:Xaa-Pro dipeptidase